MPPKKPQKPPELEGLEETKSGAHVWIDGELYTLADGTELIRRRRRTLRKRLELGEEESYDEESEKTPPTPVSRPAVEDVPTVEEAGASLIMALLKNKGTRALALWGALLSSLFGLVTGGGGGAIVGSQSKADNEAMKAQIVALTSALATTNEELGRVKAEYAAHKEAHERSAFQVEQLAVQVRDLTVLENELHPRQR